MSETPTTSTTPKRRRTKAKAAEAPAAEEKAVEQEQPTEEAPLTPEQDPKVDAETAQAESSETGAPAQADDAEQDAPVADADKKGDEPADDGDDKEEPETTKVSESRQHEETPAAPAEEPQAPAEEPTNPTEQPTGDPIRDVPNTETAQRSTVEREAPAAAAGDVDTPRHLEAPAEALETPQGAHFEPITVSIPSVAQAIDEGPGIPAPARLEYTAGGQVDPGDQHHAATAVTESEVAAAQIAQAFEVAGAAEIRGGTIATPAAAPLEAPAKPKGAHVPVSLGGLDRFAVKAAHQRRAVILDAETGEAPDFEGLFEDEDGRGRTFTVTRRLLQTQFFGVHAQPSKVLAFAKGRALSVAQKESLEQLLLSQRDAVAAGADPDQPLEG